MNFLVKIFVFFLAVTVGAFSKSTVSVLTKTNEERAREYEESEEEIETEVESEVKFEKKNFDGPEFDKASLIQAGHFLELYFSLAAAKDTSPPLLLFTPLYLLFHTWKLDCL